MRESDREFDAGTGDAAQAPSQFEPWRGEMKTVEQPLALRGVERRRGRLAHRQMQPGRGIAGRVGNITVL